MKSEHKKAQEVVKAVIFKEEKFLLQLRDNNPNIFYPNTWAFFGGGVDAGEEHEEALKRELIEELGWCPQIFKYLSKVKNITANCYITHYLIHCSLHDDQLILGEGQAMGWFSLDEIVGLSNKPDEIENVVKMANKYLDRV